MSCLTAKIKYQGGINCEMTYNRRFAVDTYRRERGINAEFSKKNNFGANTKKVGTILVQFGLVCSINYVRKLAVSKEHLWLLPENMFEDSFVVFTNVDWQIT